MLIFANKVNVMNYESRDFLWNIGDVVVVQKYITSAKINISYSILFNLTTSYSSYFGGKKGISRNKTSFFLLMWAKGGGKEGQRPNRRKPQDKDKSTNTVASVADKNEDIESWAAITADEYSESCGAWAMQYNADDEDESWATIEELSDEEDESASMQEMPEEIANITNSPTSNKVKLYNSGASQHIFSFRNQFITYRVITPHPITTADKHTFYAIGTGDMRIEVPNGGASNPILLQDALHAPDIGLTVVSISRIANAGNSISFEGQECKIQNQKGNIIARIPTSTNELYKVEHKFVGCNS